MPRAHPLALSCQPEPFGSRFQADLPPFAPGAWCRLRVTAAPGALWWAKVELEDQARGQVVREVFLQPIRNRFCRETLLHVPQYARHLTLLIFGAAAVEHATLEILSRPKAAALLLRHAWRQLPRALAGAPDGALGRVRAVIGQAPARAGEAPPYASWIDWFETATPPEPAPCWNAAIAIGCGEPALIEASRLAAARQNLPVAIIRTPADWRAITAEWVILVQPGEILSRHAVACFAQAAAHAPWASCLTADLDHLGAGGARHSPLFKPGPDAVLLRSGLPTAGACAIRWRNVPAELPVRADAARLMLALQQPDDVAHIPQILTHCAPNLVSSDLELSRLAVPPRASTPASAALGHVTMIVPSAARGAHAVRCLRKVTSLTTYPNYTVRLILSSPGKPAILRRLARLPRLSITRSAAVAFNYAQVNNEAASTGESAFLLLLNDDVAPINPDFLHAMVRHMDDPAIGIVGARLLYGNGMVQHEGVIMGLANLCEHAGRLRQGSNSGLHGQGSVRTGAMQMTEVQAGPVEIGLLDRQVSAVTAACLLIRTALYKSLGGMDTAYAIALNDVDLCLRAREAGWRVVYCAAAELYHYESLSLGRHYAGSRAVLESAEVRRLRTRFASVISADPFYSPSASLQPGREWQPAFPPRRTPPALGLPPQPPNPAAPR